MSDTDQRFGRLFVSSVERAQSKPLGGPPKTAVICLELAGQALSERGAPRSRASERLAESLVARDHRRSH